MPGKQPHNGGLRGAVTHQADLIALRFRARIQLSTHKRSLSALAGPYRSSFRGRGMDFEEVRNYQPGDDVRSIDWRVTARTGDAHTKVFREERERPVFIVVDQRRSLYFGSQRCFKSVLAAELAGLLAWSALQQGDRVGGLVLSSDDMLEVRPKRARSSVLRLLHSVHEANNKLADTARQPVPDNTRMTAALEESRRLNKPGAAVFLISDFTDFDADSSKQLFHLARHNEVTAIMVSDRLQAELPPAGRYEVSDGQRRAVLATANPALQQAYRDDFQQWQQQCRTAMARSGVPLITVQTGDDALGELLKYYAYQRGA